MKTTVKIIAAAAMSIWACTPTFATEQTQNASHIYKVEKRGGVATITDNGEPARARVFWGAVGGRTSPQIESEWKNISLEFTPERDYPKASLQARWGEASGDVFISKLAIENLQTGEFLLNTSFKGEKIDRALAYWCSGLRDNPPLEIGNTTLPDAPDGALKITIKERNPKIGGFHIYTHLNGIKKGVKYKVTARVKSSKQRNFSLTLYNIENGFEPVAATGKSTFESQIKCAKDAGVDFVSFGISGVWTPEGKAPNYGYIDKIFKEILAVNPNAKLWPRIGVDAPAWWAKANPDEMSKFSEESSYKRYASISSRKYRAAAIEALTRFIDYCEKNYPANMSGYMPTGANTGEWFYAGTWLDPLGGYDKSTLEAWRKYLAKKYGSAEKLRAAWNKNDADFDSVQVPTPAERRNCTTWLLDPSKYQNVIDFNNFLQEEMSGFLLEMGKSIRKSAPDRLSIFFYAYGIEFSGAHNSPAVSGHYGLGRLLKSRNIDIICGPISYVDRKFGDAKSVMGAAESIQLNGKIWLDEDDTSTHLDVKIAGRCPATDPLCDTLEKSQKVLARNLAQEAVRNQASWWMDLFGDGWFDSPKLWDTMRAFEPAEKDMLKNPEPYAPEIALIFDERSMCNVSGGGKASGTTMPMLMGARKTLSRSGAPFGHYLLSDVLAGKTSAKLNAFLATSAMTAKQRKKFRAVVEKSACVFALAPALSDITTRTFSTEAVAEATGFEVVPAAGKDTAIPTDEGRKIGLNEPFGTNKNISPMLSPVAREGDIVLATYPDKTPAVVLRPNGDKPRLYVGVTKIPLALWLHIARLAEVQIYADNEACVHANKNYISLCTTKDGTVNLTLPENTSATDAVSGKKLGSGTIALDLKKGDAMLIKLNR